MATTAPNFEPRSNFQKISVQLFLDLVSVLVVSVLIVSRSESIRSSFFFHMQFPPFWFSNGHQTSLLFRRFEFCQYSNRHSCNMKSLGPKYRLNLGKLFGEFFYFDWQFRIIMTNVYQFVGGVNSYKVKIQKMHVFCQHNYIYRYLIFREIYKIAHHWCNIVRNAHTNLE